MQKHSKIAFALGLALAMGAPAYAAADMSLLDAVKSGDTFAVQGLLAQKVDPNVTLQDTSTVLAWAAVHQNPEIVRLLLAAGANPNAHDQEGMTPFLFACQGADASIVEMMLDAKADPMAKRPDGISALSYCSQFSSAAVLERLIAAGAKVNAADINGQTALMRAAAGGKVGNIAVLLKHGADVNAASAKGFTPLFFAIKGPSPDAPDALIKAGANINAVASDGTTALMLAGYSQDFELAAKLVNLGADMNVWDQNGNQPLHVAAQNNQVEYAKLLIAKGANVNGVTEPSKLNWQIEPNAGRAPPPRYVGLTPLLVAAKSANLEIMKALIENGADGKFRASDDTNVVLAASVSGSLATLQYAIDLYPDTTAATDAGVTPMHLIFLNPIVRANKPFPDQGAMVSLLAEKGFPVQARTNRGRFPLDSNRQPPPEVRKIYEQALIDYAPRLNEVAATTGPRQAQR